MNRLLMKDGTWKEFRQMEMMGIINVTPDSFYDASRNADTASALETAERMIREGASFLDIGGESTRPGADPVTPKQEIDRVCPVIRELKARHPQILLSVDTYHADTAEAAVEAGADLINDISGLTFDPRMADVAAEAGVPLILMHTKGRPDVMQNDPAYEDVVREVGDYFVRQMAFAESRGILRERIMLDPGIGFGKTCVHNLALLQATEYFCGLGRPVLLAVSRKSFIGQILGEESPADRLYGTVAATLYGRAHGAVLARVHDVKANLDAVRMMDVLES